MDPRNAVHLANTNLLIRLSATRTVCKVDDNAKTFTVPLRTGMFCIRAQSAQLHHRSRRRRCDNTVRMFGAISWWWQPLSSLIKSALYCSICFCKKLCFRHYSNIDDRFRVGWFSGEKSSSERCECHWRWPVTANKIRCSVGRDSEYARSNKRKQWVFEILPGGSSNRGSEKLMMKAELSGIAVRCKIPRTSPTTQYFRWSPSQDHIIDPIVQYFSPSKKRV